MPIYAYLSLFIYIIDDIQMIELIFFLYNLCIYIQESI